MLYRRMRTSKTIELPFLSLRERFHGVKCVQPVATRASCCHYGSSRFTAARLEQLWLFPSSCPRDVETCPVLAALVREAYRSLRFYDALSAATCLRALGALNEKPPNQSAFLHALIPTLCFFEGGELTLLLDGLSKLSISHSMLTAHISKNFIRFLKDSLTHAVQGRRPGHRLHVDGSIPEWERMIGLLAAYVAVLQCLHTERTLQPFLICVSQQLSPLAVDLLSPLSTACSPENPGSGKTCPGAAVGQCTGSRDLQTLRVPRKVKFQVLYLFEVMRGARLLNAANEPVQQFVYLLLWSVAPDLSPSEAVHMLPTLWPSARGNLQGEGTVWTVNRTRTLLLRQLLKQQEAGIGTMTTHATPVAGFGIRSVSANGTATVAAHQQTRQPRLSRQCGGHSAGVKCVRRTDEQAERRPFAHGRDYNGSAQNAVITPPLFLRLSKDGTLLRAFTVTTRVNAHATTTHAPQPRGLSSASWRWLLQEALDSITPSGVSHGDAGDLGTAVSARAESSSADGRTYQNDDEEGERRAKLAAHSLACANAGYQNILEGLVILLRQLHAAIPEATDAAAAYVRDLQDDMIALLQQCVSLEEAILYTWEKQSFLVGERPRVPQEVNVARLLSACAALYTQSPPRAEGGHHSSVVEWARTTLVRQVSVASDKQAAEVDRWIAQTRRFIRAGLKRWCAAVCAGDKWRAAQLPQTSVMAPAAPGRDAERDGDLASRRTKESPLAFWTHAFRTISWSLLADLLALPYSFGLSDDDYDTVLECVVVSLVNELSERDAPWPAARQVQSHIVLDALTEELCRSWTSCSSGVDPYSGLHCHAPPHRRAASRLDALLRTAVFLPALLLSMRSAVEKEGLLRTHSDNVTQQEVAELPPVLEQCVMLLTCVIALEQPLRVSCHAARKSPPTSCSDGGNLFIDPVTGSVLSLLKTVMEWHPLMRRSMNALHQWRRLRTERLIEWAVEEHRSLRSSTDLQDCAAHESHLALSPRAVLGCGARESIFESPDLRSDTGGCCVGASTTCSKIVSVAAANAVVRGCLYGRKTEPPEWGGFAFTLAHHRATAVTVSEALVSSTPPLSRWNRGNFRHTLKEQNSPTSMFEYQWQRGGVHSILPAVTQTFDQDVRPTENCGLHCVKSLRQFPPCYQQCDSNCGRLRGHPESPTDSDAVSPISASTHAGMAEMLELTQLEQLASWAMSWERGSGTTAPGVPRALGYEDAHTMQCQEWNLSQVSCGEALSPSVRGSYFTVCGGRILCQWMLQLETAAQGCSSAHVQTGCRTEVPSVLQKRVRNGFLSRAVEFLRRLEPCGAETRRKGSSARPIMYDTEETSSVENGGTETVYELEVIAAALREGVLPWLMILVSSGWVAGTELSEKLYSTGSLDLLIRWLTQLLPLPVKSRTSLESLHAELFRGDHSPTQRLSLLHEESLCFDDGTIGHSGRQAASSPSEVLSRLLYAAREAAEFYSLSHCCHGAKVSDGPASEVETLNDSASLSPIETERKPRTLCAEEDVRALHLHLLRLCITALSEEVAPSVGMGTATGEVPPATVAGATSSQSLAHHVISSMLVQVILTHLVETYSPDTYYSVSSEKYHKDAGCVRYEVNSLCRKCNCVLDDASRVRVRAVCDALLRQLP